PAYARRRFADCPSSGPITCCSPPIVPSIRKRQGLHSRHDRGHGVPRSAQSRHGKDLSSQRRNHVRVAEELSEAPLNASVRAISLAPGRNMFARSSAATLVAAALAVAPAHADALADFYKGRQINLIVGYGPGGGYDIHARLLARHFGKFIPGHPTVVVQNMPGAGSLRAVNYLYNVAPKDEATIATFARNMALMGLLGGNSNVQFDPRRLTWLGSTSSFTNDAYILLVRNDAPVKSIEEARRPDFPALVLGATAEGATGNDVPIIL